MALVDAIIKIAKGEVGYKESYSNGHWTNHEKYAAQVPGMAWVSDEGQPWCATFVAYVVLKAGAADYYPRSAACEVDWQWFVARGQTSEKPVVGAQVFFGTKAHKDHTGIVVDFDSTYVWTVEGNTNSDGGREGYGVLEHKRLRSQASLIGYGVPKLPTAPNPAPAPVPVPVPVPVKPAAKHVYPKTLSAKVKPGRFGAEELQRALIATGYAKGIFTRVTGYYGGGTQKAVRAFFNAHPEFASNKTDVAIGANGWTYLAAKAASHG